MTSADLEVALTEFINIYKNAENDYNHATEVEAEINNATQDLLHVCEFRPDLLEGKDLVNQLHNLRIQRREAKTELEATALFWNWVSAKENKKTLDTLTNVIGDIRRVLKRQPNYNYQYKTNAIGKDMKGQWMPKVIEEEWIQTEISYEDDKGKTVTWQDVLAKEEREMYAKMVAERGKGIVIKR